MFLAKRANQPSLIILLMGFSVWLMACTSTAGPTPNAVVTSIPTLLAEVTTNPLPSATPEPVFTATPIPSNPLAPGLVSGQSCYPSLRPPPMTLYLASATGIEPITLDLAEGETDFALQLPPGEYTAYATTIGTALRGAYTQAVPCGLDEKNCTDHRLLPFEIKPGQTTENIHLCDWYAPPGQVTQPINSEFSTDAVLVTTLQNLKLFSGPGLAYPALDVVIPAGISTMAVARNLYGDWLQIEHQELSQPTWIYAPLTQIAGVPEQLPLAEQAHNEMALPRDQFTATHWYASPNNKVVHFKGFIRDQERTRINGYSVLLDNGTWSVLSHPTGASHHYPDTEDGAWDLIITNAADAAGWWALTVVSYDCPDFETGFNAQCKEFTPLSETKIVKIVYPDKHIISANWVCQYNCDQGLYVDAYRKP